jgi:rhamnogalacturonyl hydrolase YesR
MRTHVNPLQCLLLAGCLVSAATAIVARGAEPTALQGGEYRRLTHDGAWCWFSDPRAVYHAGKHERTYAGWVNRQGDIVVGALDHMTGTIQSVILHRKFEQDDHAAPSLVVLPDGRIRAFYSRHSDDVMRTRITTRPEDIAGWEPERALDINSAAEQKAGQPDRVCYSNPRLLPNGKLVLFWRGTNYKPCLAFSDDGGATFEAGRVMIAAPGAGGNNRPYLKVSEVVESVIHLAFTTGHPRVERRNSIYYCSFDGRAFRRADNTVIGTLDDLPLDPAECDVVHDGPATGVRAWIWDIAADAQGNPTLVYARLPQESRHVYHHAQWHGSAWKTRPIIDAGAWFPHTPEGRMEREPHYSGGVVLDHEDPDIVYLARPRLGVFEIERWKLMPAGDAWQHTAITRDSRSDNVRPVAIRNAPPAGPHVLWMLNDRNYEAYTRFGCSLRMDRPEPPGTADPLNPRVIRQTMERVGRWQLANPARHAGWDWTQGALYTGIMALSRVSDEPLFEQAMLDIGRKLEWKPGPRALFGDDHCVGQMYLELYLQHRDPNVLAPIKAAMDHVAAQPADESLLWQNEIHMREWAWCDALFMVPPTLALLYEATGDDQWLAELDRRWWKTTDYLYDPDEHLYYRDSRYFDQREANGQKVFWSRGNGWVIAGLARVLERLPADHPTRPRYEQLFREMAAKLITIQQPDGMWRSSLLDPVTFKHPETSGTGFYCFALAWGINHGLLDAKTYQPAVERAWRALVSRVDSNGMLEWVQPIGADPRHLRAADTDVYGVGAFLLAGEQVLRLQQGD